MAKSVIYMANGTTQELAVGSTIDLGSIIRRFGCNLSSTGESINVNGSGYYNVSGNFTIVGTNAGTATITLLKNGVAIAGASASVSLAVGDVVTVPINAIVREYGCCMDSNSILTFVLSGAAESITNSSVTIERI